MGRRYMKKVTRDGMVISHERYLYRGSTSAIGYAQQSERTSDTFVRPLEPMATRPLALVQDNALYCYGTNFAKNVTEIQRTGSYGNSL